MGEFSLKMFNYGLQAFVFPPGYVNGDLFLYEFITFVDNNNSTF